MKRKLLYANQGRSGRVIYQDSISTLDFYFEFGGNDCVAIITVPSQKDWKQETGRKTEERNDILEFIAAQATKDQAPGGFYRIEEDAITICFRK